jgi:hypothetical protein
MKTYRNKALLQVAKEAPCCMICHAPNVGQVVACHSNAIRHGKGTGHKAHDLPAYLCDRCHAEIDGRAGDWTRAEKDLRFFEAVYESVLWLLSTERLRLC